MLLVLLSVLNTEEEEETDWSQDGYEDNLSVTYGAVAAAPNVMSMEKSVPDISPPVSVEVVSPEQSGPPVPEAGLPEGWTMEQWNHYGQQWLDNQG